MDSVRSAEKTRRRSCRLLDYRVDQSNFLNQEEKSVISSRFGSVKTSPEFDGIPKHWAIVSEGFPPGVTVDELKKYGRRKPLNHLRPQDNLRLEEGSLKAYKSEYKRRYLPFCLSKVIQVLEEKTNFPKYRELSLEFEKPVLRRPQNNLFVLKDQPMESLTEKNAKYIPFPHYEKRKLLRRSTALRPEGEIVCETEVQREYIDYKNPEKVRLIRKLPSLKLEGEFEPLTTEQREKFITYLLSKRPIFEKKKSSLKMEGNFDFLTEKKLSYVPHNFSERPKIRKRSTSLKLEGEVEFYPEYRRSFVDFPRTRPLTHKPDEKIRREGEFENQTETRTQFVNFDNVSIPPSAKPENNLQIEGEMEISPEYRNNFVDFPRERPFLRRPFNQLKPEGNLELLTENSEKFSNTGETEKSESLHRPDNSNPGKELNFSSENVENVKGNGIPDKTEPSKENSDSKPEEETKFVTDKFGFSVTEKKIPERRPLSVKQDREYFFSPEYKQFHADRGKGKNLKPMEEVKSNASSPRKKASKEKTKSDFEDEKKMNREILRIKSSFKKVKETPTLEKTENSKLADEIKGDVQHLKSNLRFSEIPSSYALLPPKEFPAFKVLDLKGQLGCQSMMRDLLDSEKLTSDEENPTYRLEVYNAGEKNPGFHKNNNRIFPSLPLDSKLLEKAELRARQRAENYVKIVKSPEIPNSLLTEEDSDVECRWKIPEKLCPLSPVETKNKPSFLVLDEAAAAGRNRVESPRELIRKEKTGWLPDSMDSLYLDSGS